MGAYNSDLIFDSDGLSIVIPCYNEEDSIEEFLNDLLFRLKESSIKNFEIITINDFSKDNTLQELEKFKDKIAIYSNRRNSGYGATLKRGFLIAKYNTVAITDADMTYPNESLIDMYPDIAEYEMVVGARTGENVNIPLIRRPAKWFIRFLASTLIGETIPDLNSGLRIFRKKLLYKYFHLFPNRFSLTTTITLACMANNHESKFTPINYYKRRGKSSIHPIKDTLRFINIIFKVVMYYQPLKVFVPLAIIFIILSTGIGIQNMVYGDKSMDITTILLFFLGVNFFGIGLIADLINSRFNVSAKIE